MANVELVIKIPKELYKDIKEHGLCGHSSDREIVSEAIAYGKPLPKGHGNLIDINEITAFRELECNGHDVESLDEFTTIIEADKECE